MSSTFAEVMDAATHEWRLVFARLVREYHDATVLPPPLNIFELIANYTKQVSLLLSVGCVELCAVSVSHQVFAEREQGYSTSVQRWSTV